MRPLDCLVFDSLTGLEAELCLLFATPFPQFVSTCRKDERVEGEVEDVPLVPSSQPVQTELSISHSKPDPFTVPIPVNDPVKFLSSHSCVSFLRLPKPHQHLRPI